MASPGETGDYLAHKSSVARMHSKYKGRPDLTDADYMASFKSRCTITASGCWEWNGFCQKFRNIKPGQRGYAEGSYRGKRWKIGRLMLTLTQRPLEAGEICMHKCDNPPCINPEHLKIGTYTENMRDCSAKGRADKQWKTHCWRGHPLSGDNLELKRRAGTDLKLRCCKTCSRIRLRLRAGWSLDEAENTPPIPANERTKRRWNRAA